MTFAVHAQKQGAALQSQVEQPHHLRKQFDCVCTCVCVCVCVSVCGCVWLWLCVAVCLYVCVSACVGGEEDLCVPHTQQTKFYLGLSRPLSFLTSLSTYVHDLP